VQVDLPSFIKPKLQELLDNGNIQTLLNDKHLRTLQNLSKSGQTFIISQFKRTGTLRKRIA
jgi:hypothetical protein